MVVYILPSNAKLSRDYFAIRTVSSGVFKGRRARHLPRAPPFGGPPLRCYTHKFSLFLMKILLFTHIMYYKKDHKQAPCFQRGPQQQFQCSSTLLSQGPQQQLQFEGTLLSKGPQQPLKCVTTLLLNFIEGALKKL